MNVSVGVWAVTLLVLSSILIFDLVIVGRRPHEPSLRESALWVSLYVSLAVVFGGLVWLTAGPTYAGEFYAGWLIEYSLSMDNLFVFMLIMSRFAVPRQYQQKVLLIGIIIALVMRAGFIAAGAALVSNFAWVFYLFGAFLLYTGVKFLKQEDDDPASFRENVLVRWSRRIFPVSTDYGEGKLTTRQAGRWMLTPMMIVMIAIGTTDLVFALDSIPAIFGITREPYLIFTANVFALMGLRQLYFLIGGLVSRLVYLTYGLASVLIFIGAKMIVESLAENQVPFINGGEPVSWAPHVPIWVSLVTIAGLLGLTAVASLIKSGRDRRRALAEAAAEAARAASATDDTPPDAAESVAEARAATPVEADPPRGRGSE